MDQKVGCNSEWNFELGGRLGTGLKHCLELGHVSDHDGGLSPKLGTEHGEELEGELSLKLGSLIVSIIVVQYIYPVVNFKYKFGFCRASDKSWQWYCGIWCITWYITKLYYQFRESFICSRSGFKLGAQLGTTLGLILGTRINLWQGGKKLPLIWNHVSCLFEYNNDPHVPVKQIWYCRRRLHHGLWYVVFGINWIIEYMVAVSTPNQSNFMLKCVGEVSATEACGMLT